MEEGLEVDSKNKLNKTPFLIACENSNNDAIKILVK